MSGFAILVLVAISLGLSAWTISREERSEWRLKVPSLPPDNPAHFETILDYRAPEGQAHAPSLVEEEGDLSLLWFEGSAEAQADVDLYAVKVTNVEGTWETGSKYAKITRSGLGEVMDPRQLVVTLGNTIEAGPPGEIFATVVSLGGWAMASVASVKLGHEGPISGRKLNLSPVLNRSNLVKSPVVFFENGERGLPTYFEMGSAFSVLARVDEDGYVRDTARIFGPGKPIQPMIVPLDNRNAVAFLRDLGGSGQLLVSRSFDGGQSWTFAIAAGLPNPNAPVAAVLLDPDLILVVANDDPGGGDRLSLLTFKPSENVWHHLHELEPNSAKARYPVMRLNEDGNIMLAYSTGNKTGIRLHSFSRSWIESLPS